MKNVFYFISTKKVIGAMLLLICLSCVNKKNVIATKDANGVVIVNYDNIKDTIDFKYSNLINDLIVVQLDGDSVDNYVNSILTISDNYVLGKRSKVPIKLFDLKSGKFLTTIGNIGNGPGEYLNVEDIRIDEKRKYIFLLASHSTAIYVYDFNGKYIKEIPLANKYSRTAKFTVDKDRDIITVYTKLFKIEDSKLIWQQDFDGKELSSVIRPDLKTDGYIDEINVITNSSVPSYYVQRSNNVPDSLFSYDPKSNLFKAVFTMDLNNLTLNPENQENVLMRYYNETSNYYFGSIGQVKEHPKFKNAYTISLKSWIVVDKKDLTGGYIRLVDDFLGNNTNTILRSEGGYFKICSEPDLLIEKLNLAKKEAEGEKLTRIENIINSINEDGNYVLMYGKFK